MTSSCCGGTSDVAVKIDAAPNRQSEVRANYAAAAAGERGIAGDQRLSDSHSESLGYDAEELAELPAGANLGLGCGNPTALASIRPGDVVLDLGSGAGIDCLLAAKKVGPAGQVIGVDMTPEMLEKARSNGTESGHSNVEFRLGEIEHLPVADDSVDLVISNCVVNLSQDKPQVFREIRRVLKPGGRVTISDTATRAPLPDELREFVSSFIGCGDDTLLVDEYASMLESAGLKDVAVEDKGSAWVDSSEPSTCCGATTPEPDAGIGINDVRRYLTSVSVTAIK